MNTATELPSTIPRYLGQLRSALAGADPSLVQDALYDAEDYLRSEMSAHPDKSEAEIIAMVASSYGAPVEVADIYRETEVKVQTALRTPKPPPPGSPIGRFFGVLADARAYGALFYLLLTFATGLLYFSWVAVGLSFSIGVSILIIGVPFLILYFGSIRVLSLVEGRIVEAMLGQRMPRRPQYNDRQRPWLTQIKELFTDPRIWGTQLYFLLMMPLGMVYFTTIVTLASVALGLILLPLAMWAGLATGDLTTDAWRLLDTRLLGVDWAVDGWLTPLLVLAGVLLLIVTLHLARGIGYLHGVFAKHMLVKSARV